MRNLALTKSAKLWPGSKVWWWPSEADVGQYGAVLVIQGKALREKACIYGRSMTHALLSELADRQKWAWRAEASGFPLAKQLTLSLQKDTSISWGEAMSLTDPVSLQTKYEAREEREERAENESSISSFQAVLLSMKELVKDGVSPFLLLLQRKQKTQTCFEAVGFSDCTPVKSTRSMMMAKGSDPLLKSYYLTT